LKLLSLFDPAFPDIYFQPTYKGLKLHIKITVFKNIDNFQPTYKGLKLFLRLFALRKLINFQPTYKGLKLKKILFYLIKNNPFSAYL